MPLVRSFIAIDTPPEVKEKLAEVTEQLKSTGADVRWESSEKLHITLKFMGGLDEQRLEAISDRLKEELGTFSSFKVTYQGLGCFPDLYRPRVIWVGVENADGSLSKIQHRIEEISAILGFEKEERKFHSHITLGRVKSPKNQKALMRELKVLTFSPQSSVVEDILLKRSDLRPTGAVHTVFQSFPLKRR